MIQKIKDWWDWNDVDLIAIPILLFTIAIATAAWLLLIAQSNQYKIDCNLATGPSLKITFWTTDSPYAYDPEGFCATLRDRIANE